MWMEELFDYLKFTNMSIQKEEKEFSLEKILKKISPYLIGFYTLALLVLLLAELGVPFLEDNFRATNQVLLLIGLLIRLGVINRKHSGKEMMQTVDAVIIDKQDRLILVKRKFDPFKGAYALPGGFWEKAENQVEALVLHVL